MDRAHVENRRVPVGSADRVVVIEIVVESLVLIVIESLVVGRWSLVVERPPGFAAAG